MINYLEYLGKKYHMEALEVPPCGKCQTCFRAPLSASMWWNSKNRSFLGHLRVNFAPNGLKICMPSPKYTFYDISNVIFWILFFYDFTPIFWRKFEKIVRISFVFGPFEGQFWSEWPKNLHAIPKIYVLRHIKRDFPNFDF